MFKASNYKLSPKLHKEFFSSLFADSWLGWLLTNFKNEKRLSVRGESREASTAKSAEEEEEDKEAI